MKMRMTKPGDESASAVESVSPSRNPGDPRMSSYLGDHYYDYDYYDDYDDFYYYEYYPGYPRG